MSKKHKNIEIPKNPKLFIVNYYDKLIQLVDINTEQQLNRYKKTAIWNEQSNIKMSDHLNSMRETMIDELKRACDENMKHLSLHDLNINDESMPRKEKVEIWKSRIFSNKYCFLLKSKFFNKEKNKTLDFSLILFVLDFYLSGKTPGIVWLKKLEPFCFGNIKKTDLFEKNGLLASLLSKNMKNMSMSEHQVVHLSKSQLLETMNEKLSLSFKDLNPSLREINFEQLFGLDDDLSNLKSLELEMYPPWYIQNRVKVQIESNSLTSWSNLEFLRLEDIVIVDDEPFRSLRKLKELSIKLCDFSKTSENVFSGLTNLETMALERVVIVGEPFRSLCSLKELKIKVSDFKKSSENVFAGLTSLESLTIIECKNSQHLLYSPHLDQLNSMTADKCDDLNILKKLPKQLRHFSINLARKQKLTQMLEDLNHSTLEILELLADEVDIFDFKSISCLSNLKHLVVKFAKNSHFLYPDLKISNQLSLPLLSLKILNLSGNKFYNEINQKRLFANLPNLEELYLNNCGLANICKSTYDRKLNRHVYEPLDSEFLFGLENLKILSLVSNDLYRLNPDMFVFTPNLETLNFSENRFVKFDENFFSHLKLLKVLDLSWNYSYDKNSFSFLKCLENLKSLNLCGMNLEGLKEDMFEFNARLESLNLRKNSLKRIEKETFKSLKHLRTLDLSRNLLDSLDNEPFDHLDSLETLNLSFNNVKNWKKEIFKGLEESLQVLSISRKDGLKVEMTEALKCLKNLKNLIIK